MALLISLLLFLAMTGHSNEVGDQMLQKTLDYACGVGADCSAILQKGGCFNPDTVKDHCNYAVNSYFQRTETSPASTETSPVSFGRTLPPWHVPDNPPGTEMNQAGETNDQLGKGYKRFRPSGGEAVTEERAWLRTWRVCVSSTAVWINILGLPIEYFDEGILVNIGKLVGTPLKVDYRTVWATRGRFARICVEIELNKPLLSKVRIGKYTFNTEYEGLHMICFKCGMVGHKEDQCSTRHSENMQQEGTQEIQTVAEGEEVQDQGNQKDNVTDPPNKTGQFRPWTLVQRKMKGTININKIQRNLLNDNQRGNRLEALREETINEDKSNEANWRRQQMSEEEKVQNKDTMEKDHNQGNQNTSNTGKRALRNKKMISTLNYDRQSNSGE
ncbi:PLASMODESMATA CALLOSE-BINDING PROTEIN 3 [Hibiscus syriacus]|uniref:PLASMODESMATA CALLOSE-BINDING PROTEIN 3 n=1 Tax=Hibiscus syriacus TaxID=106335 RepID=A0A6A2Y7A7_HIBSY|nr:PLASMODESMATA CALLOSE-BINDING PROTEIN 3 [Hibiscus syriacus]